jgi:hypothetical protein
MRAHSYITKTVEYSDLYDDKDKHSEDYFIGINKRWLIEGIVHFISVDSFDSFSMDAEQGLLMMFQDYTDQGEVKRLFRRLREKKRQYRGVWLTLVNHRALFRLLRKVLMLSNERMGISESLEAYQALLKAILAENSIEMQRERELITRIDAEEDIKAAEIIMQQDMLNLDLFGENKKELEKVQLMKYLVLCEFGKENKQVGDAIKRVVNKHGFESEYSYMLLAQMPLNVYHDKDSFKEGLYCIKRSDFERTKSSRVWEEFVSIISDRSIDVWNTEKMSSVFSEKELLDNTCFRKYPVLKLSEDEYVIISQTYYSHLLYDGFWWDVKNELKSVMNEHAVMNLLTRDFSERRLFYNLAEQMVADRRMKIYNEYSFESHQPSPDFSVKTKNHLFMFEYKDMRVLKEVAEGNDMIAVMGYIDDRLNKEKGKEGGNKGIPQLIRDMEEFFSGKLPWGQDFRGGNIKIHPVLVVNSRFFGVRGINYILQQKMIQRISESDILRNHTKEIGDLLVLDYDILFLVVAQSYKNISNFQDLMFSYLTHIRKTQDVYERCDSFRHYVMNKWEGTMTKKSQKRLRYSLKRIMQNMMRS